MSGLPRRNHIRPPGQMLLAHAAAQAPAPAPAAARSGPPPTDTEAGQLTLGTSFQLVWKVSLDVEESSVKSHTVPLWSRCIATERARPGNWVLGAQSIKRRGPTSEVGRIEFFVGRSLTVDPSSRLKFRLSVTDDDGLWSSGQCEESEESRTVDQGVILATVTVEGPRSQSRLKNFTVVLEVEPPQRTPAPVIRPDPTMMRDQATQFIARTRSRHPYDVCFSFDNGLEIWEESEFLKKSSPYFATLLSGSFAEGNASAKKRKLEGVNITVVAGKAKAEDDFDDSDDEGDRKLVEQQEKDSTSCELPIHHVAFASSSYVTLRAVLCYLRTSHITFSPLSSSLAPTQPRSATPTISLPPVFSANERLPFGTTPIIFASKSSPPPPAVSPKSVYRLAHLLEHPQLMQIALDQIASSLTDDNVALELFGDVAKAFGEVYKVEMDYVVKHWATVQNSSSMKEIEALVDRDELPGGGKVLLDLARRLRS